MKKESTTRINHGAIINKTMIRELLKLKKEGWDNKLIAEYFEISGRKVAAIYKENR